jgi:hypothetical protein
VNLERNAIDYTRNNNVLSTSDTYSSISDAHSIAFENYTNHPSFKDHNIVKFDEETFDEAYGKKYASWADPEQVRIEKERKRQLEFCQFMAYEIFACNIGMNILDNYYMARYTEGDTVIETPIFLKDIFNLHIMTTPKRVVLTIHLMKYALEQEYNPVCIGLYQSEIHIRYKNKLNQIINKKFCDLDLDTQSSEVNNKIHEIIQYLREKEGESVKRPFIIFGNYIPTGESITFVNYKYGTIRSNTLLPVIGETREMHYQAFLRTCYLLTKFLEQNPGFKQPIKFHIGSEVAINNALAYEKENDERVINFGSGCHTELIAPVVETNYPEEDLNNKSIPCKIQILEQDDLDYKHLRTIFEKATRTPEDKKKILKHLRLMIEKGNAEFIDPMNKFDWNAYVLQDVRTWRAPTAEKIEKRIQEKAEKEEKYTPLEADYRFREYDAKHKCKVPYMNNKSKMKPLDCELLVAFDTYQYEGFKNHKVVMWLSYCFP